MAAEVTYRKVSSMRTASEKTVAAPTSDMEASQVNRLPNKMEVILANRLPEDRMKEIDNNGSFSVNTLIIVIVMAVGLLFIVRGKIKEKLSSYKNVIFSWVKSIQKSNYQLPENKKKEARRSSTREPVAYLSEFEELIKRYGITKDKPAPFLNIINGIIDDGKKYAKNSLKKILESDGEIEEKAKKFIEEYERLCLDEEELSFSWAEKNENSDPIFASVIESWIREFQLDEKLKEEPRIVFELIVKRKLYQFGIKATLKRLEVKKEDIKEKLDEKNIKRVAVIIDELIRRLEEI